MLIQPRAGGETSGRRRMPAEARHSLILGAIKLDGFISVARIAADLQVSEMTIRRDLEVLEERGLLTRTYGGAVTSADSPRQVFVLEEPAFMRRRHRNPLAKSAIAAAAAQLVEPNETIGIDVGTTTLALAEALVPRVDLRVFTNSLRAATALSVSRSIVYLLGGEVREVELSVHGARAVAELGNYNLDRVFIGVSGLIESGAYDYSVEDTEVKRAFIKAAREVVLLCDSSKFDHRSLARVADLGDAQVLVTDAEPPQHLAEALASAGVRVIVAPPEHAGDADDAP